MDGRSHSNGSHLRTRARPAGALIVTRIALVRFVRRLCPAAPELGPGSHEISSGNHIMSRKIWSQVSVCALAMALGLHGMPVTIVAQCILPEIQQLTASDGMPDDGFGNGVARADDVMVIGTLRHADDKAGKAYVLRRTGASWVEEAILSSSESQYGDRFGASVDTDGTRIVVGAYYEDTKRGFNAGAVYTFVNIAGVWTQEARLEGNDTAANDTFGWRVALDGTRLAVGATHDDENRGAVYLFDWNGASWLQTAKIVPNDASGGDVFGVGLKLRGDVLVAGSHNDDSQAGSVYVFRFNGASWTQEQKVLAADRDAYDKFGLSLDIEGDVLAVGADERFTGSGALYIFRHDGVQWTQEARLVPVDADSLAWFGFGVQLAGDQVLAGAPYQDGGRGAAYLFQLDGSTWTQTAKLSATNGEPNDQLLADPSGAAFDGVTAIVGAPESLSDGIGQTYVFDLTDADGDGVPDGCVPQPCNLSPDFQIEADRLDAYDNFGSALAAEGDWLAVGMHGDDPFGHANAGSVALFRRDTSVWNFAQKLAARSTAADSYFGSGVAIDDQTLVVAQYHGEEAAHVFRFDGSVWRAEQRIHRPGPSNIAFSWAIDLRDDRIVVGAPNSADGGAAFLYERGDGRWRFVQQLGDGFVASGDSYGAGITSNDQHIVVAARWRPYAIVFQRTDEGWTTLQILEPPDTNPGETMVWTDTIDMNDEWLVIGSADGGPANQGRAYVYRWDGALWQLHQTLVAGDAVAGDGFGVNVLLRDDTLVVGAHRKASHEGGAYLFHFDGVQWSETARLPNPGGGAPEFGRSLAMFGEELLVGALFDDDRAVDSGAVYGFDLTDSDGDGVPDECDADSDVDLEVLAGLLVRYEMACY